MRRLAPLTIISLVVAAALASPAQAAAPYNGSGYAIADDTHFSTGNPAPIWGQWFDRLHPKAFRLQLHWNADLAEIFKAAAVIDYVRARGVTSVLVTFKENGSTPTVEQYVNSIYPIIKGLANRVDIWGPANEPNLGDAWFPGLDGAKKLADIYKALALMAAAYDPGSKITSPDFADDFNRDAISPAYIYTYIANGGGWGDYAAWHAYWSTYYEDPYMTNKFLSYVPADVPVWITEVGAFGENSKRGIYDDNSIQYGKAIWLSHSLAQLPRIKRVYYYNMVGQHLSPTNAGFDTGLLNLNSTPRPSWNAWCIATHGNQVAAECNY
jgi:hypothetical protein